jgi:glycosyltransferase involved in cell wall biosynthesis
MDATDAQTQLPLVSVGFPLYNNARTLERAFRSVQRQSWQRIEIILSDDASTDDTYRICERLAAQDERVSLFRQPTNLYYQNFRFVLEQAKGDFFMWAAGDDFWRPRFIQANMEILLAQPEVVGSVSRCLFVQHNRLNKIAQGTYPLTGSPKENIEAFLRNPSDNTRMYGVFRREVLLKSFPLTIFHAWDWALSAGTLRYGTHLETSSVLMQRDQTSVEAYNFSVSRDHRSRLFRLFPVLRMWLHLLFVTRIPMNIRIFGAGIRLNYNKHCQYMSIVHPNRFERLRLFYQMFDRFVLWRL